MNPHTRMRGRTVARVLTAISVAGVTALGGTLAEAATSAPSGGTAAAPPAAAAASLKLRVAVSRNILGGRSDRVKGYVLPAQRGRRVLVQARAARGGWHQVARVETGSRGRFHTAWRPHGVGHYDVRALVTGTKKARRAGGGVTVYRASAASWYGPGFYGHGLACGGTLRPGTLGVAHKTLPCHSMVTLHYGSRTVTVRVIDRGPYVAGREYDLTGATKNRLGFGSTGTVWSAPIG